MRNLKTNTVGYMALAAALCLASASAQARSVKRPIAPVTKVVVAPVPSAVTVMPVTATTEPLVSDTNPFGAHIDPFSETSGTVKKHIDPFAERINPLNKRIVPLEEKTPASSIGKTQTLSNNNIAGVTIDPFGGTIDPFAGTIDPFRGNIDPFSGNIDPFTGQIDPFAGNIDPFKGHIDPFEGKAPPLTSDSVGLFWGGFAKGWANVDTLLSGLQGQALTTGNFAPVSQQLDSLLTQSEGFWGARVQAKTGKSFREGFANPLLARFGVSLTDPSSFQRLTASQRSALAFAWYDGLMSFSGADRVDHWMGTVRWNPSISRIQGLGSGTLIGLLDGNVTNDKGIETNLIDAGGYADGANAHGSAVVSLIAGAHDGMGVQGIAPNASVIAYNPFDSSGTASWTDIRQGILSLKGRGASVINLSLGVRGFTFHPDWNAQLNGLALRAFARNTVFVLAAGNDGSSQTSNIEWSQSSNLALLVVGSINAGETISSFSNRPGTACFVTRGVCTAGNELMNRFIVAPGELILASDGQDGVTRVSGTSFAAPLVSGAVTLLHDRWQWLAQYPKETADIILNTARDLGAPGVDAIYGRGVLDVQASQSPINFSTLEFYEYDSKTVGKGKLRQATDLRSGGISGVWEANDTYFYLIEKLGRTRRDFAVPLSNRLVGQKTSVSGSSEYFQSYVTGRFQDWIKNGGKFNDVASYTSPDRGGWNFAMQASNPVTSANGQQIVSVPQTTLSFSDPARRLTLSGGHGDGVRTLTGANGFGLKSDYDVSNGGVNPLLGFASGGAFVDADIALANNLRVAVGFTEKSLDQARNPLLSESQRAGLIGLESYQANAFNFRLTHKASDAASFTLGYTKLREKNGLLGVQSTVTSDLDSGSNSDTVTFGANIDLPQNFSIAASATGAVSRTAQNQSLSTAGRGVLSSAYAISLTKRGFLGKKDSIRVSFTQPLHIEKGTLKFTSVQIVDRTTGDLGTVTQQFDITEKSRRLTSEILYSAPLTKSGEMSLFGRMDYRINSSNTQNVDGLVIGGRVKLTF